jgi:fumarate hydratase class II
MRHLWNRTGITFREARNHFEAQSAIDGLVQASGEIRTIAVSLFKIANDIRWLGSGPQGGIGEIHIPETQPGSSIMPGKVNPVMSEMLMQVCGEIIGNDTTVTWAGAHGNFELNTMLPLVAWNLLETIRILTNGVEAFRSKCVDGLRANKERCGELVEKSLALATSLAPILGYDRAAEIARESVRTGMTIRDICREWNVLSGEKLDEVLDPARMTEPSVARSAPDM